MSALKDIIVVGASLAGLRACEALRHRGFDGRITLVGAEEHLPYDRPPLSKEVLRGEWEPDRIALRRDGYDELGLVLELGRRAVSLDTAGRRVELDDGSRHNFDAMVIATGAAPRKIRGTTDGLSGLYTLRTLDDAIGLRSAFERNPRVVVVGAGFIGAEVAASARKLGLDVTMIEPQPVPLAHALGPAIGEICAALHRDHGVQLRLGTGIEAEGIEGHGRVESLRLDDGTRIEADVVVLGIGVEPVTAWLQGSGIELGNGIVCDSHCRTSVPGIVAAGDVAHWYNPLFDEAMRVEHWSNAVEMAGAAVQTLLDGDSAAPYAPVPNVWSDQHGVKIQTAGRIRADDRMQIVQGDPSEYRFTALFGRNGRLSGVLTFRRPRQLIRYSEMLEQSASWEEALTVARATG